MKIRPCIRQMMIVLTFCCALFSCAGRPEPRPMVDADSAQLWWKSAAAEIAALKQAGTPREEWDALSDSVEAIETKAEAEAILGKYENLSDAERQRYLDLFNTSAETVHYGFEGDFRALVFFDRDGLTIDAFLMSA